MPSKSAHSPEMLQISHRLVSRHDFCALRWKHKGTASTFVLLEPHLYLIAEKMFLKIVHTITGARISEACRVREYAGSMASGYNAGQPGEGRGDAGTVHLSVTGMLRITEENAHFKCCARIEQRCRSKKSIMSPLQDAPISGRFTCL